MEHVTKVVIQCITCSVREFFGLLVCYHIISQCKSKQALILCIACNMRAFFGPRICCHVISQQ